MPFRKENANPATQPKLPDDSRSVDGSGAAPVPVPAETCSHTTPRPTKIIRKITPIDIKKLEGSGLDRQLAQALYKSNKSNGGGTSVGTTATSCSTTTTSAELLNAATARTSNTSIIKAAIRATTTRAPIATTATTTTPTVTAVTPYAVTPPLWIKTNPTGCSAQLPLNRIEKPTITIIKPTITITAPAEVSPPTVAQETVVPINPADRLAHAKRVLNSKLTMRKRDKLMLQVPTMQKTQAAASCVLNKQSLMSGNMRKMSVDVSHTYAEHWNKQQSRTDTVERTNRDYVERNIGIPPVPTNKASHANEQVFGESQMLPKTSALSPIESFHSEKTGVELLATNFGSTAKNAFPEFSPLKHPFISTNCTKETPLPRISSFKKPRIQMDLQQFDDPEHEIAARDVIGKAAQNLVVLEDKVLTAEEKIDITALCLPIDNTSTDEALDIPNATPVSDLPMTPSSGAVFSHNALSKTNKVGSTATDVKLFRPVKTITQLKLSAEKVAAINNAIRRYNDSTLYHIAKYKTSPSFTGGKLNANVHQGPAETITSQAEIIPLEEMFGAASLITTDVEMTDTSAMLTDYRNSSKEPQQNNTFTEQSSLPEFYGTESAALNYAENGVDFVASIMDMYDTQREKANISRKKRKARYAKKVLLVPYEIDSRSESSDDESFEDESSGDEPSKVESTEDKFIEDEPSEGGSESEISDVPSSQSNIDLNVSRNEIQKESNVEKDNIPSCAEVIEFSTDQEYKTDTSAQHCDINNIILADKNTITCLQNTTTPNSNEKEAVQCSSNQLTDGLDALGIAEEHSFVKHNIPLVESDNGTVNMESSASSSPCAGFDDYNNDESTAAISSKRRRPHKVAPYIVKRRDVLRLPNDYVLNQSIFKSTKNRSTVEIANVLNEMNELTSDSNQNKTPAPNPNIQDAPINYDGIKPDTINKSEENKELDAFKRTTKFECNEIITATSISDEIPSASAEQAATSKISNILISVAPINCVAIENENVSITTEQSVSDHGQGNNEVSSTNINSGDFTNTSAVNDVAVTTPKISEYIELTNIKAELPSCKISEHVELTDIDVKPPTRKISEHAELTDIEAKLPTRNISEHAELTDIEAKLPTPKISEHAESTDIEAKLPTRKISEHAELTPMKSELPLCRITAESISQEVDETSVDLSMTPRSVSNVEILTESTEEAPLHGRQEKTVTGKAIASIGTKDCTVKNKDNVADKKSVVKTASGEKSSMLGQKASRKIIKYSPNISKTESVNTIPKPSKGILIIPAEVLKTEKYMKNTTAPTKTNVKRVYTKRTQLPQAAQATQISKMDHRKNLNNSDISQELKSKTRKNQDKQSLNTSCPEKTIDSDIIESDLSSTGDVEFRGFAETSPTEETKLMHLSQLIAQSILQTGADTQSDRSESPVEQPSTSRAAMRRTPPPIRTPCSRAMPLKKRWDLSHMVRHETDISDDTSPMDDDEEVEFADTAIKKKVNMPNLSEEASTTVARASLKRKLGRNAKSAPKSTADSSVSHGVQKIGNIVKEIVNAVATPSVDDDDKPCCSSSIRKSNVFITNIGSSQKVNSDPVLLLKESSNLTIMQPPIEAIPEKKKRGRKPKNKLADETIDNSVEEIKDAKQPETESAPKNRGSVPFNPRLLLIRRRDQLESEECLTETELTAGTGPLQCGLCLGRTTKSGWVQHLSEHYGVGWVVGSPVQNITLRSVVLSTMTSFYKHSLITGLPCRLCRRIYRSALGLLQHLENCGAVQTRYTCEQCGRNYTKFSLTYHMRTCSKRPTEAEDKKAAEEAEANQQDGQEPVLNNFGRAKRLSLLKAESKVKATVAELVQSEDAPAEFDPKAHIKYTPPDTKDYSSKWESELDSFGKAFCPYRLCKFNATDAMAIKAHISACKMRPKHGYYCMLCKRAPALATEAAVIRHICKKHRSAEGSEDDSNYEITTEEEVSASDDDISSFFASNDEDDDSKASTPTTNKSRSRQRSSRKGEDGQTPTTSKKVYPSRGNANEVALNKWFQIMDEFCAKSSLYPNAIPKVQQRIYTTDEAKCKDSANENGRLSMKFTFLPNTTFSNFMKSTKKPDEKWTQLKIFEQCKEKNSLYIYVGAPIKMMAWAPLPPYINDEYLVVVRREAIGKYTRCKRAKLKPSRLLVYKLTRPDRSALLPEVHLHYAVRIPDGPVHCIAFLPTGGYAEEKNRLGLLAVAAADSSSIRIYSLPLTVDEQAKTNETEKVFESGTLLQIDLEPTAELLMDEPGPISSLNGHRITDTQCVTIVWSQALPCNHICAGFANGYVCMWDIAAYNSTESDSDSWVVFNKVVNGVMFFTPMTLIYTGERSARCLALHYNERGLRWLAVANLSRQLLIYDLKDMVKPDIIKETVVTSILRDMDWPVVWETIVTAHCDLVPTNGRVVMANSPLGLIYNVCKIDGAQVAISKVHYHPGQNLLITATDNGDIIFNKVRELHLDDVMPSKKKLNRSIAMMDIHCFNDDEPERTSEGLSPECDPDYLSKYGLIFTPLMRMYPDDKDIYQNSKRVLPSGTTLLMRVNELVSNLNYHRTDHLSAIGYENGLLRIVNYGRTP